MKTKTLALCVFLFFIISLNAYGPETPAVKFVIYFLWFLVVIFGAVIIKEKRNVH